MVKGLLSLPHVYRCVLRMFLMRSSLDVNQYHHDQVLLHTYSTYFSLFNAVIFGGVIISQSIHHISAILISAILVDT